MDLFEIVNSEPTVTAQALLIPEFSLIWKHDKSKDKSKAMKMFAYIYYSTDYKSKYLSYSPSVRRERLGFDFMGDVKYKPESIVDDACKKYEELQQTPTMNFLKAARNAMQFTEDYFNSIDYSERDMKGNPVYKVTDVTRALKDCSGVKDTLDKLMDAVKKEQSKGELARGGGKGGEFEMMD